MWKSKKIVWYVAFILSVCITSVLSGKNVCAETYLDMDYIIKTDEIGDWGTYVEITSYEGNDKEITIPGEINGIIVKIIGDSAFADATMLEMVHISEGIQGFGYNSFARCTNLKKVELPSTLRYFDNVPFQECPIEEILFPNGSDYLTYKNASLIQNNVLLAYYGGDVNEYKIADGVEEIFEDSFSGCSIQSIIMPESVERIAQHGLCISDLEKCYINNPNCHIIYDEDVEWGCYAFIWDKNNEPVEGVTVYGVSDSYMETQCKKANLSFVSTGKLEQYTTIIEGEYTKANLYKDGNLYYSFCPKEDGDYQFSQKSRLRYIVVRDEQNVALVEKSDGILKYYKLEGGKQYSITVLSENYNRELLVKKTVPVIDIDNSSVSLQSAKYGDTIVWKFKLNAEYQLSELSLSIINDMNKIYCITDGIIEKSENEIYLTFSFKVPEWGHNGLYKIYQLEGDEKQTGYRLCIGNKDSEADYQQDFGKMNIQIIGMREDFIPPKATIEKIKISVKDEKIKFSIPVTEEESGLSEVHMVFGRYDNTNTMWQGEVVSLEKVIDESMVTSDGLVFEENLQDFMEKIDGEIAFGMEDTFALQWIRIIDKACNYGDTNTFSLEESDLGIKAAPYNLCFSLVEKEPEEHGWSEEGTIAKEPTCMEKGVCFFRCLVEECEEVKEEEIPELGHDWSDEWIIGKEPTCASDGEKSHHCNRKDCTEIKDVTVIPATGKHTYDAGTVTLAPTCTTPGVRTYICTICKNAKTEEIPATGTHTYGEWKETVAPTCNTNGKKERQCTTCSVVETEEIPATGFVKGGEFTKGDSTYTIKTVKGKKGTVVYEGTDKKAKKVKVPKTVKIEGKTYTVTEIGAGAFKSDTKLKSVTIPEGITKIGKEAFSGCKNLTSITIKSTKLTSVGSDAIKGIHKKAIIKVPEKKYDKYKKLFKSKTGYKKSMMIKK